MMRSLLLVIGAATLAGCAIVQTWDRPNATQAELDADGGQCEAQALSISRPMIGQREMVHDACMRGKGWTLINSERK